MKAYEYEVGGRVLCKSHSMLRCSECEYVDDLEKENNRLRKIMESSVSEIKYALYSNKSKDVKEHYLKNAERYIADALDQSHE